MKCITGVLMLFCMIQLSRAETLHRGGVQLLCHRTANEDVPENTLESLEQAALLGCDVVEIDLRRTEDGEIVLNHDGILERLTDGVGDLEKSLYGDLQLRDAGSWMGKRFTGLHIAKFEDAVRLARELDIRLVLDMKDKGLGEDVLRILDREGMLQRVQFGGEWEDVKQLNPSATSPGDGVAWIQPGVTIEQVKDIHRQGKAVVANFSANSHEMDLDGMRAAVANGVDGINVDYPRLGADAVGRPVEDKIHQLLVNAASGESESRIHAILTLSRYRGFPLQNAFAHWLEDADAHVSRAAAVALVNAIPRPAPAVFQAAALKSSRTDARANAAWALGMLNAPASYLVPLLRDADLQVLQAALLALGRTTGDVGAKELLPLLGSADPRVGGAAAIALAKHQPAIAVKAIPERLKREIASERVLYDEHLKRGGDRFTPPEIEAIMKSFRGQMEMVRALSTIEDEGATRELIALALRPDKSFSQFDGIIAAFQLWDRAANDAAPLVQALGMSDLTIGDRAEWILTQAGPDVLADVRKALDSGDISIRTRAIRILAWQGDLASVEKLNSIRATNGPDAALAAWAIEKIQALHPPR